ncbi:hypothetical protein Nepgr_000822 [Nepenthes gracilis]|uniref:Uncharacterized protein n=1 Tax=Nepenthes gracilis TaxID=150966 RepID=A0AAD3RX65_NEPGR|nr:hypothetical protein Nepgr_000822 [Nepenthes gracilis]
MQAAFHICHHSLNSRKSSNLHRLPLYIDCGDGCPKHRSEVLFNGGQPLGVINWGIRNVCDAGATGIMAPCVSFDNVAMDVCQEANISEKRPGLSAAAISRAVHSCNDGSADPEVLFRLVFIIRLLGSVSSSLWTPPRQHLAGPPATARGCFLCLSCSSCCHGSCCGSVNRACACRLMIGCAQIHITLSINLRYFELGEDIKGCCEVDCGNSSFGCEYGLLVRKPNLMAEQQLVELGAEAASFLT